MDPLRTAAAPETRLHFLDYWRIIRIRKAVIILVFLLVSITATFVTFLLPKAYSSKARIRVNHDTTDVPNMAGMPVHDRLRSVFHPDGIPGDPVRSHPGQGD